MKRLIILIAIVCSANALFAQTTADALRYSRVFYGGTARFQGLGGAFGALGADFSVLQTNPAGIGIYRSSEFSIGPTTYISSTNSDFMGQSYKDHKTMFGMSDVGMVFTIKTGTKSKFKNFNVGFGLNRENDFNNRIFIRGANNQSSILTDWTYQLNGPSNNPYPYLNPDQIRNQYPFDIALSYDANLIYDDGTGFYSSDIQNGGVIQEKSVTTAGSMHEFNISFGGNFNDVLYFGATVGIPYLRYFETSVYREYNNDPGIQHFNSLKYAQEIETYGTGVNFKAGVIVKPAPFLRIGAAVHTPTMYGHMRDNWDSYITSEFYDSTQWNSTIYSPLGNYDYKLVTPFRAIGSVAVLIGPYGLVSAEYEYVNYGTAKFYDKQKNQMNGENSYRDLNDDISGSFKSPLNLRAGTEWRIDDFRVRGGVGYYGSPYTGSSSAGSKIAISGGVGYRGKHFFTDLSYVWSKTEDDYYLYNSVFAKTKTIGSAITATFGVKF